MESANYDFVEGEFYRHFKGNIYQLLHKAVNSETGEDMVVYKACYGDGQVYVRPAKMWNELVERDGKTYKRFTSLTELVNSVTKE